MMTPNHIYGSGVVLVILASLLCSCNSWITLPHFIAISPHHRLVRKNYNPIRRDKGYTPNMIGTGFSFEDGEQVLVSVQKPFGIVLEQDDEDEDGRIVVTEVDPNGSAGKAGVREGDILVAVQNASTVSVDLGDVLDLIATKCPRVVNLRFQRT